MENELKTNVENNLTLLYNMALAEYDLKHCIEHLRLAEKAANTEMKALPSQLCRKSVADIAEMLQTFELRIAENRL